MLNTPLQLLKMKARALYQLHKEKLKKRLLDALATLFGTEEK